MANIGITPVDPASPVGALRNLIGDLHSVPLSSKMAGFASYDYFSDAELLAFLAVSGQSTLRAAGHVYAAMSRNAIAESIDITQDDMRVATVKRAADWLALSGTYFKQATEADALAAVTSDSFFQITYPKERDCSWSRY